MSFVKQTKVRVDKLEDQFL